MNELYLEKNEIPELANQEVAPEIFSIDKKLIEHMSALKMNLEHHEYHISQKENQEILASKYKIIDSFIERLSSESTLKNIGEFLESVDDDTKDIQALLKKICSNDEELDLIHNVLYRQVITDNGDFQLSQYIGFVNNDNPTKEQVENLIHAVQDIMLQLKKAQEYNSSNPVIQDNIAAKYIGLTQIEKDFEIDNTCRQLEDKIQLLSNNKKNLNQNILGMKNQIAENQDELNQYKSYTEINHVELRINILNKNISALNTAIEEKQQQIKIIEDAIVSNELLKSNTMATSSIMIKNDYESNHDEYMKVVNSVGEEFINAFKKVDNVDDLEVIYKEYKICKKYLQPEIDYQKIMGIIEDSYNNTKKSIQEKDILEKNQEKVVRIEEVFSEILEKDILP